MARLTLTPAQVTQLNDWLYGGPTDPTGIIPLLNANAAGQVQPPLDAATVYEQEGERDLYLLLLAKNGGTIRSQDLTQKMKDSLQFVAGSLQADQDAGRPIPLNQEQMRALWKFAQAL